MTDPIFQVVATIGGISSTRASAYVEPIEGHEGGVG